ncbi:hypothetical protein MMC24_000115 [Lignoscripta atroalba]|nr:hypothetical protein [Lignoscripta atroalba]
MDEAHIWSSAEEYALKQMVENHGWVGMRAATRLIQQFRKTFYFRVVSEHINIMRQEGRILSNEWTEDMLVMLYTLQRNWGSGRVLNTQQLIYCMQDLFPGAMFFTAEEIAYGLSQVAHAKVWTDDEKTQLRVQASTTFLEIEDLAVSLKVVCGLYVSYEEIYAMLRAMRKGYIAVTFTAAEIGEVDRLDAQGMTPAEIAECMFMSSNMLLSEEMIRRMIEDATFN